MTTSTKRNKFIKLNMFHRTITLMYVNFSQMSSVAEIENSIFDEFLLIVAFV